MCTTRRLRFIAGATLLAFTALGAESASPRLQINACDLLQAVQIEDVTGSRVGQVRRQDEGLIPEGAYSSTCIWLLTPESAHGNDARAKKSFVIINAMRWPRGSDGAKQFLEAFREAARSGEIPSFPEARTLGDESLSWGDGLAIRKGDFSVGLSVFMKGEDREAMEERLGSFVLHSIQSPSAAPGATDAPTDVNDAGKSAPSRD